MHYWILIPSELGPSFFPAPNDCEVSSNSILNCDQRIDECCHLVKDHIGYTYHKLNVFNNFPVTVPQKCKY